jgi:hypothetical protein
MKPLNKIIFLIIVLTIITYINTIRLESQVLVENRNRIKMTYKMTSSSKLKLIVMNGALGWDVGSGIQDSTWICGRDGSVYRFDPMNIPHNIKNQAPKCKRVDIDYEGLPWLVSSDHHVWRLMHEADETFVWMELNGKIHIII